MNTSLEARALAALESYLDLEPGPRAKALALLRAADPELHAQVMRLLQADALQGVLETLPQDVLSGAQSAGTPCSGAAPDDDDPRIGSVLGAWRIEALIGKGGMGKVYRASRADGQYAQVVAIKCVGTEVDSPALAAAIRNERSTLAQLEHPNIGTLLDGGIDSDGYPWFAMQLVHGQPIDTWCDQHRLTLEQRVALFITLCDGLAYAHAKSALHSDVKPSNILVDAEGRPVLLDFGLSTLTTPGAEGVVRPLAMTPDYTAPETAACGYSVRTDIYALGTVLYVLLCGSTPPGPAALVTTAPTAVKPAPPSQIAAQASLDLAQARGLASPAELARRLHGDLDAIALACIAHVPEQRYPSVASLQADLQAWLHGRPVSVRQSGFGYRARLFLRRHRGGVVMASCGLLVLFIGLGWAWHAHREAQRHAESARSMRQLFDESLDLMSVASLGTSPLLSDQMLQAAEQKVRKWSLTAPAEVRVHGLLALAKSYAVAGDYRRAQALVNESRMPFGDETRAAFTDAVQAHLFNLEARYPQAVEASRQGLAKTRRIDRKEREAALLALEVELARGLLSTGQAKEGHAVLEQALARAQAMTPSDSTAVAEMLTIRGEWRNLFYRYEEADRDYKRAIALTQHDSPVIADNARIGLARNLVSQQRYHSALAVAREVLANRRKMFGDRHPESGKAWTLLAVVIASAQSFKPDMAAARRGEEILRASLGPDHPAVAEAMQTVGLMQVRVDPKALDGVVADARKALAIVERQNGPVTPEAAWAKLHLAAMLATRYDARMEYARQRSGADDPAAKAPPGSWSEVVRLYSQAVSTARHLGMPMLWPRVTLIRAKLRAGQTDSTLEAELRQLIAELAAARGPLNPTTINTRWVLAELYRARNDTEGAADTMRALVRDTAAAEPGSELESIRMKLLPTLAQILQDQGKLQQARSYFLQGQEISLRLFGSEYPVSKEFAVELATIDRQIQAAKSRGGR